jgi:hypothetical protein
MATIIRMYQTYNSQYARPDDESSYSTPMTIDAFLPFIKAKFYEVTDVGLDVEINVPLESITREWLEGLVGGSVTYVVGIVDEGEYDDEIRLRIHTYDIPVQIPTPLVRQQSITTPSKIRVYQTYMDDTDRATPLIGKPLAVHKFIEYVKHEYRTALEIMWDDIRVSMEDITREWLEGLAVDSHTELIGSEGEDLWLRVHVYELELQDTGDEAVETTRSVDKEQVTSNPNTGFALVKLEDSNCGTGYHIRDVLNLTKTMKLYSNPDEFCAYVNDYIMEQMTEDCINAEECTTYCGKPHGDFHVYPMGTCIKPSDLANLEGNMIIIDEPREHRDKKNSPRELAWICKVDIADSVN